MIGRVVLLQPLLRSWTFGGCHWVSHSAAFGCSALNYVSQFWLRPLSTTSHAFQMFSAQSCIPIMTWTSFVMSTSLDPQSCSYLLAMTKSYFTFHLLIQLTWHSASLGFDPSIGLWPLETSTTVKLSYMPLPLRLLLHHLNPDVLQCYSHSGSTFNKVHTLTASTD